MQQACFQSVSIINEYLPRGLYLIWSWHTINRLASWKVECTDPEHCWQYEPGCRIYSSYYTGPKVICVNQQQNVLQAYLGNIEVKIWGIIIIAPECNPAFRQDYRPGTGRISKRSCIEFYAQWVVYFTRNDFHITCMTNEIKGHCWFAIPLHQCFRWQLRILHILTFWLIHWWFLNR